MNTERKSFIKSNFWKIQWLLVGWSAILLFAIQTQKIVTCLKERADIANNGTFYGMFVDVSSAPLAEDIADIALAAERGE